MVPPKGGKVDYLLPLLRNLRDIQCSNMYYGQASTYRFNSEKFLHSEVFEDLEDKVWGKVTDDVERGLRVLLQQENL
jgi:hypothetical protein